MPWNLRHKTEAFLRVAKPDIEALSGRRPRQYTSRMHASNHARQRIPASGRGCSALDNTRRYPRAGRRRRLPRLR
jgi:hypothetical protein